MRPLHTPSLSLLPLQVAHADEMFGVLSDPAMYRWLDYPPPPSLDHLRQVYRQLEGRQSPDGREDWLNWVLALPDSRLIGVVQATVFSPAPDAPAAPAKAAWVAWLLNSAHTGRGHARVAVSRMLDELARHYQVRQLLATIDRANARSIHLAAALGFQPANADLAASHDLPATDVLYTRALQAPPGKATAADPD